MNVIEENTYTATEGIGASDTGETATGGAAPGLTMRYDRASAEAARWEDLARRAAAESKNNLRRIDEARRDSNMAGRRSVLMDFLPVMDAFRCGLSLIPDGDNGGLATGMRLVARQADAFLASQGVAPVGAAPGTAYDYNLHEAVGTAPGAEGTIVNVVRDGYRMDGRLLRPATVVTGDGAAPAP